MKRLVLIGASGMAGSNALRFALDHPNVEHVLSIGRKTLRFSHPRLSEVQHANFADCSALKEVLVGYDAVIFCLGTYTGSVSEEELRKITLGYTVEFASVLREASPQATFTFLSGNGDDNPLIYFSPPKAETVRNDVLLRVWPKSATRISSSFDF
jgi:putative NADH-flavin reductase